MAKPNADDIHQAVEAARARVGGDTDEAALARCFLYLHDRNRQLESVYEQIEKYLNSGMAEHEHSQLLVTLEHAREADHRWAHEDQDEILGL
jgi:hypothetical protein